MAQQTLSDIFENYVTQTSIFKNKDVLTDKYMPENILHRSNEINQVVKILSPAMRAQKVSNLFVYGSVGTGKSISIKSIATELENRSKNIKTIYINCKMKRVSDTEYRLLAELARMFGKSVPATGLPTDKVYRICSELLKNQKKNVILILDEIDALIKKIGDEILYNLTRLNEEMPETKLSIIGISNDIVFIEALDPRVKSSLSEEEVIFPPYNASQLKDILKTRAKRAFNNGVLQSGVIEKCAALAAQEHGDARKALDLLRISGEVAEREDSKSIGIDHVDQAENKLDFDRTIAIVRAQPKQSKAVLAAILKLTESGERDIQTGDIFSLYEKICKNTGLKILTQRRVSDLIAELDMFGVINARVISKGRYGRTREIKLAVSDAVLKNIKKILHENYLL